jgi:hypothetical protein
MIFFGLALLVIGALNAVKPDFTYRMNRWQYKNKDAFEPSSAALVVTRVGGVIALVAGVVVIIVAATR